MMLANLFTKLKAVHVATTQPEREAIYRFRYRIYVEELHRELGGVDHEKRMVTDAEDDKAYSHHFYAGSIDDIEGSVRLRVWAPGEMPPAFSKKLSMHLFGPAQARLRTLVRLRVRVSQASAPVSPSALWRPGRQAR